MPGFSSEGENSKYRGVRKYAYGGVIGELAPTRESFT
jgi:hypothetical protein